LKPGRVNRTFQHDRIGGQRLGLLPTCFPLTFLEAQDTGKCPLYRHKLHVEQPVPCVGLPHGRGRRHRVLRRARDPRAHSRARGPGADALLAQTSTSAQDVSLFADMLSLPNDERYPALDMTPEQRRQKTLEALGWQMEALSRSNPVLMISEDAHWADPTSLEVFSRTIDRLRNLRVLLIVTFRPEFDPPWIGRPYGTAVTLNRLAQRDIEAMIDGVVGNKLNGTALHVRRIKNGSPSTHPLTGRELRALRQHLRESNRSSFVFVSERGAPLNAAGFSRMVERVGKAAGLGLKAHAHMLRHACGYALANAGHDTRALQAYLGHRNIQNTVIRGAGTRALRGVLAGLARRRSPGGVEPGLPCLATKTLTHSSRCGLGQGARFIWRTKQVNPTLNRALWY